MTTPKKPEYMFPELQGLPDVFKRLSQAERTEADKLPNDSFYRPTKAEHIGASNAYLVAAQMLEERLNG